MSERNVHLAALVEALDRFDPAGIAAARWGIALAGVLWNGGKLLAAGNGGSAAQAQHLTAEIVGRYRDDRPPFCAIALHTEPSALTAILNDYGPEEVFARQLSAHGRPGDVCILLSTSGASRNLLATARRARECGVTVWAMTGPAPNPLAALADEVLVVDSPHTATVQELHLVALHMLCEAMDEELNRRQQRSIEVAS
jgi:D-sedoheptulose 7-phosphate isomerase